MAGDDAREQGAEDRTEPATPRRIERAREEGQVALSREAVALGTLAGGLVVAAVALPPLGAEALRAMRGVFAKAGHALAWQEAAAEIARTGALAIAAGAGGAALGAAVATLLQTRGLVAPRLLRPQLARISPRAGLRRLVGAEAATEWVRTALKLGAVGAALWSAAPHDLAQVAAALHLSPAGLAGAMAAAGARLVAAGLAAFALIAALDLLLARWRHLRHLRMSRQELREELRESEGDPQVKAKLRQIRQARSRRRMLAAVRTAAVVVTNPTHYAVALAYERGSSAAPRVVAKGVDTLAARIRAEAERHGVPVVSNPPLARALYGLELEAEIPVAYYQAVAEIIAFVWRRSARTAPRPAGEAETERAHGGTR
ncbi:EscU/YscU/HrcU family type III secretion system export apparatus switch protein [Caldovatus aquaticus]|uniref:EscU/YscU/HrcU family type III secretion system export apparatus switch protein n=1 Tax=Caldovatus aquaticus TaxID=2865671 RepID=A0ABS7F2K9_9PROT|nr:EscU/YscU/HrcU family type III secretion system export apparatus switch protein [Caldovatus aquaticus]MBW8269837.1 EscU/YscU/HrcU family type III secretion system export apparatus switch protein [Caldovatus aquaticus]